MSDSEAGARRRAVASGLAGRKLDAMVVSSSHNLRYLTGFTGSNGLLLIMAGDAVFLTDPRYGIQAANEVDCKTRVVKGPLWAGLIALAQKKQVRRLGFEKAHVSFDGYEFLRSHVPMKTRLEPVAGWIEQLRMIKSEREIELLRGSAATNSRAFTQVAGRAVPGMREAELAARLDYRMRLLGAERPAFETIVASGERSALPHARPTSAAIGKLVLIDMGALRDGYASDMTRMLYLGRPDAKVKRLYRAVLKAQQAAMAAVCPGVTTGHVDRQARSVLRAEKLDRAFVHSTGHGLGLEIHEPPRIGKKDKRRLEKGMVITIEPGVYLEGYGGIRIEDTVVVTETGCEVLTSASKELLVV